MEPIDIAGKFKKAAIQAVTPLTLLDAHAEAGERLRIPVPEGYNAWVFVIKGGGTLADGNALLRFSAAIFEPQGDYIEIEAGTSGIEFLLGMGRPINEESVFGGPFVMSSADQLLETRRRFGRGEMGELPPSVSF